MKAKPKQKLQKYLEKVNSFDDKCITGYELKETPKEIEISYNETEKYFKSLLCEKNIYTNTC